MEFAEVDQFTFPVRTHETMIIRQWLGQQRTLQHYCSKRSSIKHQWIAGAMLNEVLVCTLRCHMLYSKVSFQRSEPRLPMDWPSQIVFVQNRF